MVHCYIHYTYENIRNGNRTENRASAYKLCNWSSKNENFSLCRSFRIRYNSKSSLNLIKCKLLILQIYISIIIIYDYEWLLRYMTLSHDTVWAFSLLPLILVLFSLLLPIVWNDRNECHRIIYIFDVVITTHSEWDSNCRLRIANKNKHEKEYL